MNNNFENNKEFINWMVNSCGKIEDIKRLIEMLKETKYEVTLFNEIFVEGKYPVSTIKVNLCLMYVAEDGTKKGVKLGFIMYPDNFIIGKFIKECEKRLL